MPISQTRITNAIQEGKVILKLVDLSANALGHSFGSGHFCERLREFEHGPPHSAGLIFDFLSIDVHKWPCK